MWGKTCREGRREEEVRFAVLRFPTSACQSLHTNLGLPRVEARDSPCFLQFASVRARCTGIENAKPSGLFTSLMLEVPSHTLNTPPSFPKELYVHRNIVLTISQFPGASPREDEEGSEEKIQKVAPGVIWEWEGDGGVWGSYSAKHCQALSSALVKDEKELTLKVTSEVKMKVRFDGMTQTNVATGWQRNIRCTLSPSTSSPGVQNVWEWEDSDGDWRAYSPATQRLLHACRLCGSDSVQVEMIPGKMGTVDLKALKQKMEGGKMGSVRCRPVAG